MTSAGIPARGVSALALDWQPGAPAPQFSLQYYDSGKAHYLPTPTRDTFHTYVAHFIAGRTDGTTVRAGALTVWADGANTPVIDLNGINTLQRYNGVTQKWMQLWEGDYTQALPIVARTQFALTRIGKTLPEALADRPVAIGGTAAGQFYTGNGVNLGAPTSTQIASRLASDARIPASLGGSGATAPTTTTTTPTVTPTTTTPTTTTPARPTTTTTATTTPAPTTTPPTSPTPTTTPTKTSPGLARGKNKTDRALSSVGPALLEWDGRLFHSAADFRTHLTARGVRWNTFLNTHPAVVSALSLPSVKWDGMTFFDQLSLKQWLAKAGDDYAAWAKGHPSAVAILTGRSSAVKPGPARTLAVSPVLEWDGIGFTTAAGLRQHLGRQGIRWNSFLTNHPSIAKKFALPSVQWETRQFFTRAALSAWLIKHGTSLQAWGAQHPAALARIS